MGHKQCLTELVTRLEPKGFECHPFKVGWYNDSVQSSFRLDYPSDTLAVLIISAPAMFEKALLPFILQEDCLGKTDPIDACIAQHFKEATKAMADVDVDILYDYEVDHLRRPRILVQTAGHVSGAAHYYQRKDVSSDVWPSSKRIFGVSIHPKYGGWFAFRAVVVCRNVLAADLPGVTPPDPLPNDHDRIELLTRFNENWKDGTYRDIIPTIEKYSELQKLYFSTLPKDRLELVRKIREKSPGSGLAAGPL